MMLKPFRIRGLYDTSPGVIQLTGIQYDATIRSQPDAALSYLDDDDGETILVGSSLELEQRLDEPVASHAVRNRDTSAPARDTDASLHTFDIQKSPASLATWREHEAYTSKALRKVPVKLPNSSEPLVISAITTRSSMPPPPPPPQSRPDQPVSIEDAIKGALQGLETHVGAFAGFLQDTSNTLRTVAENTREADLNAIGGIIDGFKGIFGEIGKVGKAMVEAFDAEAFAHPPSVSQTVVDELTVKKPDSATREVEGPSNSNNVTVIGRHSTGLASGPTLAEADSTAKPTVSAKLLARGRANGTTSPAEAPSLDALNVPFTGQDPPRTLYPIFSERYKEVDTSLSSHNRTTGSASCAETHSTEAPNAPFAAYASLKDPWKINSDQSRGSFFACNHYQKNKTDCRRSFSGEACQICVLEKQPCSFVAQSSRDPSVAGSVVSPPSVRYLQSHEIPRSDSDDLAARGRLYRQQLNAQHTGQVQLPRETAKTYTQPLKASASRSILDLENSDPDFSTRYPPLMSLRKSKTIGSLADRSKSPFLVNINPEAAISRFPSLSQIEHEARSDRRVESLGGDQDLNTRRWSFVKDSQNLQQPATRPRLVIPARQSADVAPATPPMLPGAWPEPRLEADGPMLPTSEESSGAFFDRMTRSRSPEPATRSFRYIPAHIRHSRPAGTPYVPRHLREPLNVDTTYVPPHLRHAISVDNMAPQLGRSNTVTSSNPAARLTRPFDPLENARQSRDSAALPRRSGTERYRRRPYNESFTGAGRMPWESFEHVPQAERPAATRREPRPSRRDAKPFNGDDQSSTCAGFGISEKVGECVRQLRDMGYGNRSPHEASRLSIYAAACNGDVVDAVEMIEEDRKAGRQHKDTGDRLGVKPFNHNDRPTFGR